MITLKQDSSQLLIPGYRHIKDRRLIIRLEGDGNYTLFHLKGYQKPLMVSQTLKYFENQLPGFIRVSKSSFVNPEYIDRIVKAQARSMYLLLTDGARVVVSRRRMAEIQATLQNYVAPAVVENVPADMAFRPGLAVLESLQPSLASFQVR